MGGDQAPAIVFEGLQRVIGDNTVPFAVFEVYGIESVMAPFIQKYNFPANRVSFISCTETITSTTEPRMAVRGFRDASMRRAIEAVAEGRAQGVVSAGNTGAYMALSKLILKTLEGIYRPAIISTLPTMGKPVVMLDLGANVDITPEVMVQFCLMGQAFAKAVLHNPNPSVALLNVGSEELKGTTNVKEAHQIIQKTDLVKNYRGYVEGDDIFKEKVDVIVTDGFTGNVALKTIEGSVKFFAHTLKTELSRSWISKIGALLAKPAFDAFKNRVDPRYYNGAPFMGLKGISVKSHGGMDGLGFATAIKVAINLANNKINEKLQEEITVLQQRLDVLPYEENI